MFFIFMIIKIPCNATDFVRNTRSKATVRKAEDTNKAKTSIVVKEKKKGRRLINGIHKIMWNYIGLVQIRGDKN